MGSGSQQNQHAATIAAAVTGPMPGRASSCSTVAVLRSSTSAVLGAVLGPVVAVPEVPAGPGVPAPTELPSTLGCPEGGASPTTICSPSPSCRAMFSPTVSAPSTAPPAACSASAIRAPGARVTSPGVCTRPTTLTTTGRPERSGEPGLADDLGFVGETGSTGGSLADITGSVRSRIKVNTVTSTARAAITANATAPARPGSARILSAQPCPREVSGSQRGSSEFGSSRGSSWSGPSSVGSCGSGSKCADAACESISGTAPSRLCSRSAGSSVRMGRP